MLISLAENIAEKISDVRKLFLSALRSSQLFCIVIYLLEKQRKQLRDAEQIEEEIVWGIVVMT